MQGLEQNGSSSAPSASAQGGPINTFQVGQRREAPPPGLLSQVCKAMVSSTSYSVPILHDELLQTSRRTQWPPPSPSHALGTWVTDAVACPASGGFRGDRELAA